MIVGLKAEHRQPEGRSAVRVPDRQDSAVLPPHTDWSILDEGRVMVPTLRSRHATGARLVLSLRGLCERSRPP